MPKTLSLKKSNAQLKNQKPITQFFKNVNESPKKPTTSPVKSNVNSSEVLDSSSSKRKAVSPAQIDLVDNLEESCNRVNRNSKAVDADNAPKKYKTETSSNLYSQLEKSPEKENDIKSKSEKSPEQIFRSKRSPLSPYKNENGVKSELLLANHGDKKIAHSKNFINYGKTKNNQEDFSNCKEEPMKSSNKIKPLHFSPAKEISKSPSKKTESPNVAALIKSPNKKSSPVKKVLFDECNVDDVFNDDWGDVDFEEETSEDLDLSTMQRCEILSVQRHPSRLELRLRNSAGNKGKCFVEGMWLDTPLSPGEWISIFATRDPNNQFFIGNTSGLLALRPDHLVSSTSVVAGVFCRRKAVLQERWRGIDSANTAMTIGILIHELVQKALTQNIRDFNQLKLETDALIRESIQMLYDAGITEEEARSNMQAYLIPLVDFMKCYVGETTGEKSNQKDKWNGHIDKVLDIEENICCPQLGLKGKIDATLQVTIHERKGKSTSIVPLELKSGKASASAEHRGQLVMYGMMLCLQRDEDPSTALQKGLLLYLRDRVELREVSCGYPERRDLMMLRNHMVQYLAQGPEDVDPEQLTDIEDASILLQQRLPEPIRHENACTKCAYLTLCSLHLWHTDGPTVSESHPLSKLRDQAMGHLTPNHVKYFLHWTALLKMEERGQQITSPLHALWTDSVEKRSKRGTCAANLQLISVETSGDRYLHKFKRQTDIEGDASLKETTYNKGPQEGDFSIVSLDKRPWIAAGVVALAKKQIHILLERDLSRRQAKDTLYHIDTYESYATTVQNLTNLGVLMEDSDRAERLRSLIIDKQSPEFEKKLPRDVGRIGTKLMKGLNIDQQRAVLKAVSARNYALLQGLPGTGKTQTISVLIQMLVALKQRVLVTAHTHSAVDTVLSRLPASLRVMRLGSSSRVASNIIDRSEQKLAEQCETAEQLEKLYESMDVVGVTCLGAAHAMLSRTTFDICIVDEATQVLQCTVLRPLFAAKRFVLVGDPEQLPPVVRSRAARRLGMEDSLFHRLMNEVATSTLRLQYRMNQALADVANKVAYSSRLKCANDTVAQATLNLNTEKINKDIEWLAAACNPEPEFAAVFLDMKNLMITDSKGCTNAEEACLVLAIVSALNEAGVKSPDIGIIAPYRDQVALVRRALLRFGNSTEVSTVDQFQGRDKSVIIYSCTKKERENKQVKDGEVLNDQRRLAVSVTRAKHKLIVNGNSAALQHYEPLQRLINACKVVEVGSNTELNKYRTYLV